MSAINDSECKEIYRNTVGRAVCTHSFKEDIYRAMVDKQNRIADNETQSGLAAGRISRSLAMVALLVVIMVLTAPIVIRAYEKIVIEGISYNEKEIEGVEDVLKLWFNFDKWGQELEHQSGGLSDWQEYYPEFYAQLEESNSLDVWLPHYKMGEYEWSQGYGYIGRVYEGDVHISASFTNGDSVFTMDIHCFSRASGSSVSGKLEYHEEIVHNGIQYQIYKYSDDYTYDEYCRVFDETIPAEWEYVKMSEEEFYQWMAHPIHITTKINGYNYSFSISEDIEVEEFLDTIY